ncbi:unnamed protein product, partial [Meganyctiphanes norvegica]
ISYTFNSTGRQFTTETTMQINWNLAPIKLHYTLRYIGTAPLIPLISMIVRDKGIPAQEIGLLWTIMPIIGLLSSGVSGIIADYSNAYRGVLITNLFILLLGSVTMYLAPRIPSKHTLLLGERHWYNISTDHYQEELDIAVFPIEYYDTMVKESEEPVLVIEDWEPGEVLRFREFWLSATSVMLIQIGILSVMTLEDTICFQIIGCDREIFGQQRVLGVIGMGILTPVSGALVDWYSEGLPYRDYLPTFSIIVVFTVLNIIIVATTLKLHYKGSCDVVDHLGFRSIIKILFDRSVLLILSCILVGGYAVGIIWYFTLLLVEDVSLSWDPNFAYQNLLQGFVISVDTFAGDLPFYYFAGFLIKKFDHKNIFAFVMFVQATRCVLYSFVTNPWYFLPIELLHGPHVSLYHATLISYANYLAPAGTEATFQAIFAGLFSFARSLSGYSGGYMLHTFGHSKSFMYLGLAFGIFAALFSAQYLLSFPMKRKSVDISVKI